MSGSGTKRTAILISQIVWALAATSVPSAAEQVPVACVQMRLTNSVEANTATIVAHIGTEAARGTRVAVFPECAISGYDPRVEPSIPQVAIDEATKRISAACAENDIYAIVGTTWLDQGVRRNSVLVLGPDGRMIQRYDKMHVVESYNRNGDRLAFFRIDGVPATIFICHDERYPELMRIPVLGGARIAFYISFESPSASGKNFNYRCQIVGRAIENQTWVVHCNAPAENEGGTSHGHSRIISPDGTIEQEAGEGEAVIRHRIDTKRSSQAWVQAGASEPPFDRFWQEGLRVLQQHNPNEFTEATARPQLLPEAVQFGNSPHSMLRIACAQMAIADDLNTNVARSVAIIEQEAARRSRVVVFPERALTGHKISPADKNDQDALDGAIARVAEACRASGVYCIIGAAFRENGALYNGAYVIDPAGSVIKRYAQIHTAHPDRYAAGSRPAMFKIDGVYATVMIGHDIHYPELGRVAVLGGARILLCLAHEQASASVSAAESQVVCRSVENQVFTVWCNAGRENTAEPSTGHSRIVNPAGRVLAEAGEDSDTAIRARVDTTQTSYNYARAGANTPSLRAFWQEGLAILRTANPEFYGEVSAATTMPDPHPQQ